MKLFHCTARIWEFIELSTKKRIRQRLFNTYMIILNIRCEIHILMSVIVILMNKTLQHDQETLSELWEMSMMCKGIT
jgi:hypothetical protein